MKFTIRNGITGQRIGKLHASQAGAEQEAVKASVTRKQSFDVIRHTDAFDTFGQPVSFASAGTVYPTDFKAQTDALFSRLDNLISKGN